MNPAAEALAVYDNEACSHTFLEALEWHLAHGWVHSTPEFFAMGRPVCLSWSEKVIVDPFHHDHRKELTQTPNCWHIALMAGDVVAARNVLPFTLPFISFERRNNLKVYRHDDFWRTTLRLNKLTV